MESLIMLLQQKASRKIYNHNVKTGMDFRCQVWKRVLKMAYFGLK